MEEGKLVKIRCFLNYYHLEGIHQEFNLSQSTRNQEIRLSTAGYFPIPGVLEQGISL